ncbi:LytR/AlgR family response regulator transcription factor [Hymenobacter terrenus]|uniref:LytR/AlgR family response regulator transcription factor n=1 Tax=Hymenobacter terrenus TaxID=1629124 RepID=UPI0006194701|nr:LytTR family transcriptional regulator DNA-binding domain-containing protein [Hymenobacter terrenus]
MAQILIVEDEFIIAEHLRSIVEGLGHEVVGVADHATDALKLLRSLPMMPTVALLDITLRGELDGIDLAGRLRAEFGLPFVFVTSLADAATVARAKQAHPRGYLVKPFDEHEVFVALEMALAEAPAPSPPALLTPTSLFVRDRKQLVRVDFGDLYWLEADGNYTTLHTRSGTRYTAVASLKQVEERLPPADFLRIHKSYIVAVSRITILDGQTVVVAGRSIPVGRAYQSALMARLNLLGGPVT